MDELPGPGPQIDKLISGTAVLFLARLTAMALGLFQAILLATKFGTSTSTDAYFVASAVCFLFSGPIEGTLNQAFVPVFVHAAEAEGEDSAWRIGAGLFRIGLGGLGGIALLLAAVSPWLAPFLAPGLDEAAVGMVARLIRLMAPVIPFVYIAAFLSTMEFIRGRYSLPALGITVHAMAGPLSLLLFADRFGVVSLVWGLVAGAVLRCLLLLIRFPGARRLLGPGVRIRDPAVRQLGKMITARILTSWFLQLNFMVDRAFASLLGPGAISALDYASRAVMTVVRLFMMPMGRVLLPVLSRLAAKSRYRRIRGTLEKLVIMIAFLLVPMVAFMGVFRRELLGFVFQRGAFDATAVEATADALLFYSLGIVPFLVTPLLTGAFFALRDSAVPLKVGLVCVFANALLDAVLVVALGHGGIALATSLVGAIRALLLWSFLRRHIGALRSRAVLGSLVVSASAAAAAFWTAQTLVSLWGADGLRPLWRLAGYAVIGGAGYLLLQGIFNRPVVRLIPQILRRRAQAGGP